jgi:hypothetical protein
VNADAAKGPPLAANAQKRRSQIEALKIPGHDQLQIFKGK